MKNKTPQSNFSFVTEVAPGELRNICLVSIAIICPYVAVDPFAGGLD